jgi:hypothetical protein
MTTVRGISEAVAKLQEIGAEGERIASREIVAAALDIHGEARRFATDTGAVDTGRLRNSITVAPAPGPLSTASDQATGGEKGSGGGTEAPLMVEDGMLNALIGTNVDYALSVHYGTTRTPGRPFLTTPFELGKPKLLANLTAALKGLESA